MKIEPSGVILLDVCSVQTNKCIAKQAAPITAIWALPGRIQINVCRPCLEEQVRLGEWEIPGARIQRRIDIAVRSLNQRLILIVEVRKSSRAKIPLAVWATKIHRNLLAHSGIPPTPYFLLAILPGSFYLWKGNSALNFERQPDYEVNANEILQPYFDRLPHPPEIASDYELEALMTSWLKDISSSHLPEGPLYEWLRDSGLYEALRGGSVEMQMPVAA